MLLSFRGCVFEVKEGEFFYFILVVICLCVFVFLFVWKFEKLIERVMMAWLGQGGAVPPV